MKNANFTVKLVDTKRIRVKIIAISEISQCRFEAAENCCFGTAVRGAKDYLVAPAAADFPFFGRMNRTGRQIYILSINKKGGVFRLCGRKNKLIVALYASFVGYSA